MYKIPALLLFCAACLLYSGLLYGFPPDNEYTAVQPPDTRGLTAWWSFDESAGPAPGKTAGGDEDSLFGNYEFVRGIAGKAMKFNGFRTYVKHSADRRFPETQWYFKSIRVKISAGDTAVLSGEMILSYG